MDRGYVKQWRKTLDTGILKSHEYFCFWSWCLLKASYKDRTVFFNGVEVELVRGEFIFGRRVCADALSISEQKVRTLLKKAIKNGQISTSQTTNRYSILSIVKWDTYQDAAVITNQPSNLELTSDQPTVNQQSTSNQPQTRIKEGLKGKNVKKESKTFVPPTRDDLQTFCEKNNLKIDIDDFIEFYGSKGWMVGRTKMKNWELAARRAVKWESNQRRSGGGSRDGGKVPADNLSTQDYNEGVNDDGTF